MKTYFERLCKIGVDAVKGLRQLDAQHMEMQKRYHEDFRNGVITASGYERYLKELDEARVKYIAGVEAQIENLKAGFAEATARHLMPTGGNMNMADVEILKNFKLSSKEFEDFARKYANNATMGRMLEKYRTDNNVDTGWRFQTEEQRNEIFRGACASVISIMGQSDKYSPAREDHIAYNTAKAYHKLQGSVADAMPVPADPTPAPGTVINNGIDGAATAVGVDGRVYSCF